MAFKLKGGDRQIVFETKTKEIFFDISTLSNNTVTECLRDDIGGYVGKKDDVSAYITTNSLKNKTGLPSDAAISNKKGK